MDDSKKREPSLVRRLGEHLSAHLKEGEAIAVAVSGGGDSSALLHAITHWRDRWQLSVCHINHGISPHADLWENFCRQLCRDYNLPITVHRATPPSAELATEDWARNIRLRTYSQLQASAIVLAHHANDQAETVLFRLLRGSGVHGMAAIRDHAHLAGKILLRPWLDIDRREITRYARQHRLRWIEDEDNDNLQRRRNFLRWRGLAVLAEQFPHCHQSLVNSGRHIQEASAMLLQLAAMDEKNARTKDGGLAIAYFRQVGEMRTRNWLYRSLLERQLRFTERHINETARQILHARQQRTLRFHFQNIHLHRWRDHLYWDAGLPPPPDSLEIRLPPDEPAPTWTSLNGRLTFTKTTGDGLSLAKTGGSLQLRPRQGGERLTPAGRPTRRVADLLQESAVYPWRRRHFPLLYAKGELAAVPGIAISERYLAGKHEPGLQCHFEWQTH